MSPKGAAGKGEKECRRKQKRADMIRKSEDDKSLTVAIATREMFRGREGGELVARAGDQLLISLFNRDANF
jgi:hypothetical protein